MEGRPAGTASLELFDRLAHLRSVAVGEEFRGAHVGALLAARAAERARERGAGELYAVTEGAAGFFERLGFERIGGKDDLPEPIASTPMVRERCSTSSVSLRLDLE
jgi:amino-acid N-acetyltransferase